jgi:hypothetical protein
MTVLDMTGTTVKTFLDDGEASWPTGGNLQIDGLTYERIDPDSNRLTWLKRIPPTPFRPQPYSELSEVLRNSGNEADAREILIAREDDRLEHSTQGFARFWGYVLKYTIQYGYRPMFAMIWAAIVVGVGWLFVQIGKCKHVLRYTGNGRFETHGDQRYEDSNSFLYSLNVFLPIVDLRQEKNWWPEVGTRYGRWLRMFLWVEII